MNLTIIDWSSSESLTAAAVDARAQAQRYEGWEDHFLKEKQTGIADEYESAKSLCEQIADRFESLSNFLKE